MPSSRETTTGDVLHPRDDRRHLFVREGVQESLHRPPSRRGLVVAPPSASLLHRGPSARIRGALLGSLLFLRDGFVHLSTEEQLARRHPCQALRRPEGRRRRSGGERGGALFPHLYGALRWGDVRVVRRRAGWGSRCLAIAQ